VKRGMKSGRNGMSEMRGMRGKRKEYSSKAKTIILQIYILYVNGLATFL
jgi:hypothetical protein